MKRWYITFALSIGIGQAFGQTTVVKGLKYNLDETALTATVGLAEDVNESVTFPKEIVHEGKTYQVTGIVRDKEDAEKHFTQLKSVEIEDGIASIGESAFAYCTSLEKAELPNSITSIGQKAFENCPQLESVAMANGITTLENRTFAGCTSLSKVRLSQDIAVIGTAAFDSCVKLKDIELPENLTRVSSYAFRAAGLSSIHIPAKVSVVNGVAFLGCPLETITVDKGNPNYYTEEECNAVISMPRPNQYNVLVGCKNTTTPKVENVTFRFYVNAFAGRPGIRQIVPTGHKDAGKEGVLVVSENVVDIVSGSFQYLPDLESAVIPATIENVSFPMCRKLSDVTFEGSTKISGFNGTAIKDILITGDVEMDCFGLSTMVNPYEFPGLTTEELHRTGMLEKVTFSDDVTSIGFRSFQYNSNLTSITLGKNIKKIGAYAFNDCPLKEVYCSAATPPELVEKVFMGVDKSACTLYVPTAESKKLYQEAAEWKDFLNIEVDPSLDPNGIQEVTNKTAKTESVYNLQGQKQNQLQKGVNIIRTKDGTTRKVLVK